MDDTTARSDPRAPSGVLTQRSALIAGVTGLVGGFLLDQLLDDDLYGSITALVRRPLDRENPKLKTVIADFDRLEASGEALRVDDVFCSLGTTIKKAGSQAAFRKVDHDYVAALARLSRAAGTQRFLLVSSIGAASGVSNFYLSVKGAAEEAVTACGFPELHVFRPSLLTGPRQEQRSGERAAIFASRFLGPLLIGGLRRYRPMDVRILAAAMVVAAKSGTLGQTIYTFDEIVDLAERQLA
ncbi:MAG: NAD(P)H-binding protein [Thermoanaerobaculia bacterium]|nr:NAD(P)H-binding protein [Thermoanaerobaculia bacterium]